jgi:hypothetical protein
MIAVEASLHMSLMRLQIISVRLPCRFIFLIYAVLAGRLRGVGWKGTYKRDSSIGLHGRQFHPTPYSVLRRLVIVFVAMHHGGEAAGLDGKSTRHVLIEEGPLNGIGMDASHGVRCSGVPYVEVTQPHIPDCGETVCFCIVPCLV